MAESKFLRYQDRTGTGIVDACDEYVEVPVDPCAVSSFTISETAIVPNWQTLDSQTTFLNQKIGYYQVPIETQYSTTIDEALLEDPTLTTEEADAALQERYDEYIDEAVIALLEENNKDDSQSSKDAVKNDLTWDVKTDYYLEARAFSRLRLLYSVPYETISSLPDAQPEPEDEGRTDSPDDAPDSSCDLEATFSSEDLESQLTEIRKGLKLYGWYSKISTKTDGTNFYFREGPGQGSVFNLDLYGDWGELNGSLMGDLFSQLGEFVNLKGYTLSGDGQKVSKLTFTFNKDYELTKLKLYIEGREDFPLTFKERLGWLKRQPAWKDPTCLAYLANLGSMHIDLTAREPISWSDFVIKYTFPSIELIIDKPATSDPEDSSGSKVRDALEFDRKQLGEFLFDPVFNLGDAIAFQFHRNLVAPSLDIVLEDKIKLGQIWDPNINPEIDIKDLGKLKNFLSFDPTGLLSADRIQRTLSGGRGSIDLLWGDIFDRLKLSGLMGLLMGAIQELFSGLSFEDALGKILLPALKEMDLESFDYLFSGFDLEIQGCIEEIAKAKVEEEIGMTLSEAADRGLVFYWPFRDVVALEAESVSDTPSSSRTLAETYDLQDVDLTKIDSEIIMKAVIDAVLECYFDNYLELLDHLNKFPGSELVSFIIATAPFPTPPALNAPTLDFIKNKDFPSIQNTFDITMPRLENPFGWLPQIKDLTGAIFKLVKFLIQQIILKILITMLLKICAALSNASADPGGSLGELAAGDRDKISLAIEASITGLGVDLDILNGTTADMFGSLGMGTSALGVDPGMPGVCPPADATSTPTEGGIPSSGGTSALPSTPTDGTPITTDETTTTGATTSDVSSPDTVTATPGSTTTDVNTAAASLAMSLGADADTAALADTTMVLNFASDISSAVTTEELYNAFLGTPSPDFLTIVDQIVRYEYPDFEGALKNKDAIESLFTNMGNLMPEAFKAQMNDVLDTIADDAPQAAGLCSCSSPEQIQQFNELRGEILAGRATPEQIQQLGGPVGIDPVTGLPTGPTDAAGNAIPPYPGLSGLDSILADPTAPTTDGVTPGAFGALSGVGGPLGADLSDLGDLANILQAGLPAALEDAMPPLLSDPGCDNGILPFEPEESTATATAALGGGMEQLKADFAHDMMGSGRNKRKWGLMNMVLSDTMGIPLTAHYRKVSNRRRYVDFYLDQDDEKLMTAIEGGEVDLPRKFTAENLFNAILPEPPKLGKQRGAFPVNVAAWLKDQLDGLAPSFESNNTLIGDMPNSVSFERSGISTFGSGLNLLKLDSEIIGYNTKIEVDFENEEISYTELARKLDPDLTLSFKDNCKGLQALEGDLAIGGSAYAKSFDVELYLSDLVSDDGGSPGARNYGGAPIQAWAITSVADDHSHTYTVDADGNGETSRNDGHTHTLVDGAAEEYCEVVGTTTTIVDDVEVEEDIEECHTHTLLAPASEDTGVAFLPRDTARIRIMDKTNAAAFTDTRLAAMIPVIKLKILRKEIVLFDDLQEAFTPKNTGEIADGNVLTWIANNFTFPQLPMEDMKYEFLSIDNTLDGINFDDYPKFVDTFANYQSYAPQVVLLNEILSNNGYKVSTSDTKNGYDTIMTELTQFIIDEAASNSSAFAYGAQADILNAADTAYVIGEAIGSYPAGTSYYDVMIDITADDPSWMSIIWSDGKRPILNRDRILGVSAMSLNDPDNNRVFYLDPLTFGSNYLKPPLHIAPIKSTGWLGMVDVMFPEKSPCRPYKIDLINFADIQDKIDNSYPNIPEDERLKQEPDYVIELPYHKLLDRSSVAGIEALIYAAIRIYGATTIIQSLATMTRFAPIFPGVYSSLYASYVIEEMAASFKSAAVKAVWEKGNPFKDNKFWYAFLEQGVQLYARRVDAGDITSPPEPVLDALRRLNDMQAQYQFPDDAELESQRGQMAGLFESLEGYRDDKNYEAVQATEDDAKLIFKELVMEQLNSLGKTFTKNLASVGMAPDVYDLDYYLLQYLTSGGEDLTLNQEIINTYPNLYVEGDATEELYTKGNELATSAGEDYVGYYHVVTDDDGKIMFMEGEFHSDEVHDTLSPFVSEVSVNIGDIADYGTAGSDKSFTIEKYVRIGSSYNAPGPDLLSEEVYDSETEAMVALIMPNISDVYPGTLELVTDSTTGDVVGVTGELGVRYGLRFSLNMEGTTYTITEVEVNALDVKIYQFDPETDLGKDSKLLYCLINKLKDDGKIKLVSQYIFALNKLTATTAIYNGEAFLPSIGEKVVPLGALNSDIAGGGSAVAGGDMCFTFDPADDAPSEDDGWYQETDDDGVAIEGRYCLALTAAGEYDEQKPGNMITFDADGAPSLAGVEGWAHKVDRDPGFFGGRFVTDWDEWDQVILRNSKSRIRQMFKGFYNSRRFKPGQRDESADTPGSTVTEELKEDMIAEPGDDAVSGWQKRKLRGNPFNANGEMCEEKN